MSYLAQLDTLKNFSLKKPQLFAASFSRCKVLTAQSADAVGVGHHF